MRLYCTKSPSGRNCLHTSIKQSGKAGLCFQQNNPVLNGSLAGMLLTILDT